MTTKTKRERLSKYLDELSGDKGIRIYIAIIGDVLNAAIIDGVQELLVTSDEYNHIRRWMACNGQWSWDGKTFMGISIVKLELD